jgi:hypothetical protein
VLIDLLWLTVYLLEFKIMDMHNTPISSARRRFLLAMACAAVVPTAFAAEPREISWEDLVPADWDPSKSFEDLKDLAALPDSDQRVQKLYDRMREVWDNAPTVRSLAGQTVKLPGYLVPIERDKAGMREFLLVPYFGACIHTPPPPANQIIHVRSATPIKGLRSMDAIWVSGVLGLAKNNSEMGVSGYSMTASRVVKYKIKGNAP